MILIVFWYVDFDELGIEVDNKHAKATNYVKSDCVDDDKLNSDCDIDLDGDGMNGKSRHI